MNVQSRERLISGIRREEQQARSTRDALARADQRKMSQIADSNKKLALKLFTSKPTYQVMNLER